MHWITSSIASFFSDILYGILDVIGDYINKIFALVAAMNDIPLLDKAMTYTTTLGLVLIVIIGIKKGIEIYILQVEGDAEEDPMDLLIRCIQGAAVVMTSAWIYKELIKISGLVTNDIVGSVTYKGFKDNTTSILGSIVSSMSTNGLIWIVMLLVLTIGIILFCFTAGIRGAELALGKILLPIFAVDLVTTNRERWNNFFSGYMVLAFGYALQVLSFKVFITLFASASFGNVTNIICCFGWLVLMIRAPRWIEKYAYTSGVGGAVKGGARTAAYAVPMALK